MYSWQIALAWLGILPVMGVIGSVQVALMNGGQDEVKKKQGKALTSKRSVVEGSANSLVGEAVTSIRTVPSPSRHASHSRRR